MTAMENVATALAEGSSSGSGSFSTRGIAKTLDLTVSMVHIALKKIMQCYSYKVIYVQELFAADFLK